MTQMQKKLQKELGAAAQKEGKPKDPLLQVAEEMREVQQRLDQRDSGDGDATLAAADRRRPGEVDRAGEEIGTCSGKNSNGRKPTGSGKKPAANPGQPSGEFFGARPG